MLEPGTLQEQSKRHVYELVDDQMDNVVSEKQIKSTLYEKSFEKELTAMVIDNLNRAKSAAASHSAGTRKMHYGTILCMGGIIVITTLYQFYGTDCTGEYCITGGAIALGVILFIRGFIQTKPSI